MSGTPGSCPLVTPLLLHLCLYRGGLVFYVFVLGFNRAQLNAFD